MAYTIESTTAVQRALRKLPIDIRRRLERAIADLAEIPRPSGCKKIQVTGEFRIRVGDYRVRYSVDDELRLVVVNGAGLREHFYDQR